MYEPAEDSLMLQKHVLDLCRSRKINRLLDMGTGSGIIALSASEFCEVVAVDIDDESLDFVRKKISSSVDENNKLKNIKIIKSNLFSEVSKSEKFDIIAFNPPYLPKGEDDYEDVSLYGGFSGEELTIKFLSQVGDYLSNCGIIIFIASSLANIKRIEDELNKSGFIFRVVVKEHYFFEDIILYEAHLKD